jgi:nanoRNase/pAp phosphatase (c-di-AMP/oligoRNAs hydrolase)
MGNTNYLYIEFKHYKNFSWDLNFFKAFVKALRTKSSAKWILFLEGKDYIRVGLRSDGSCDVSALAKKFGGGGHGVSAGTKLKDKNQVDLILKEMIDL